MIYSFSLPEVATVLGLIYILSHGWALFRPVATQKFLKAAPRNLLLGEILLAVAIFWFVWVLSKVPLMEYEPHRSKFILVCILGGALTGFYVREFLTVRAAGALLLLLAELMLEAAFLRSDPGRLFITVTAYAYVVIGCFLVGSPYLLRDVLEWVQATPGRYRAAAAGGLVFGGLCLFLGLFVY